ncbi:MAG: SAM-dependent chlorinase/fluorinase [Rhodospirillales bacterium]|nr:SAM-dependent chlorinase/fluorinase [Rhodospirillales bacterium]MDP6644717.1 SAM-dependent chlorinase/fluorinase [Rhodospirillales bacterium]
MIVLFTDFGLEGPYIGQVKARILKESPNATIIDLFSDAPMQNPKACSYLLAAYASEFPAGTVFLAVVDPGVGGRRPAVAVEAGERWYVGPGNGLFEMVARRSRTVDIWEIDYAPNSVSASFHGRDVFAPVAAALELGSPLEGPPRLGGYGGDDAWAGWPDDLAEIIYIDRFGNAITGLRARFVEPTFALRVNHVYLEYAGVFSDVPKGQAFWYENSNGLVEVAVNQGRADELLGIQVGSDVWFGERASP